MHKNSSIFNPIKQRVIAIGITLLLILGSFFWIQNQSSQKEYENKVILNIFATQQMLTQQMSKDANGIYAIIEAGKASDLYEIKNRAKRKKQQFREDLQTAEKEFSTILTAMHTGYFVDGGKKIDITGFTDESGMYLISVNKLWEQFDASLDVIAEMEETTPQTNSAIVYINDNNGELLRLSNQISEGVLAASVKETRQTEYLFYCLVIVFIIILIDAAYNLVKYILLPLQQLYQGIHEIGIAERPKKTFWIKPEMNPAVSDINQIFHKFNNIISLIENINNNSSFMETLNFINETFTEYIPYDYIGIALMDKEKKAVRASYGVSNSKIEGLPEKLLGKTVMLSETSLGHLIEKGEARIINDLEAYTDDKVMKSYNKIILDAGIKASITLPLKVAGESVGLIFFSSSKTNVYTNEHINFLRTLVNSIAISFNQNIFIHELLYSDIIALAKLAEARDEDTGEHLDRMKLYSKEIALMLLEEHLYPEIIDSEFVEQIEKFSPLHDIGKVGISDQILLKPAKLTKEEFDEMKRHTTFGADVLRAAEENLRKSGKSLFKMGIEISESHHERWDGTGYPHGKGDTQIPLSARIVSVADVLDALTSKRPYKEAFPFEDSLEMIQKAAGTHFDPDIVELAVKNQGKLKKIYDKYQK